MSILRLLGTQFKIHRGKSSVRSQPCVFARAGLGVIELTWFFIGWIPVAQAEVMTSTATLMERLEACNPTVIKERLSVDQADFALAAQKSSRYPTFSISANGFEGDDSKAGAVGRATLPIWTFGKLEAQEARAAQDLSFTAQEYESFKSNHLAEILGIQARSEEIVRRLNVLNDVLDYQRKLRARIENRIAAGRSAQSDLISVDSKIGQTITDIKTAQSQYEQARAEQGALLCPGVEVTRETLESVFPNSVDQIHLDQAPTILRLSKELAAESVQLDVVKTQDAPTINAVAEVPTDDEFQNRKSRIGVEFSYEYRTFGRQKEENIKQQLAKIDAIEKSIQAERDRLGFIQSRLAQDIDRFETQLIPNHQTVVQDIENRLASKTRLFDTGRVALFELITIYDELKAARLNLIRFELDLDQFQLDFAANQGGLVLHVVNQ